MRLYLLSFLALVATSTFQHAASHGAEPTQVVAPFAASTLPQTAPLSTIEQPHAVQPAVPTVIVTPGPGVTVVASSPKGPVYHMDAPLPLQQPCVKDTELALDGWEKRVDAADAKRLRPAADAVRPAPTDQRDRAKLLVTLERLKATRDQLHSPAAKEVAELFAAGICLIIDSCPPAVHASNDASQPRPPATIQAHKNWFKSPKGQMAIECYEVAVPDLIAVSNYDELAVAFIKKYPGTNAAELIANQRIGHANDLRNWALMARAAEEAARHARTPQSLIYRLGAQSFALSKLNLNDLEPLRTLWNKCRGKHNAELLSVTERLAGVASEPRKFDLLSLAYDHLRPAERPLSLLLTLSSLARQQGLPELAEKYLYEAAERSPQDVTPDERLRVASSLNEAHHQQQARRWYEAIANSRDVYPGYATERAKAEQYLRRLDNRPKPKPAAHAAEPAA